MSTIETNILHTIERDGFVMLSDLFSFDQVQSILSGVEDALAHGDGEDPAIRGIEGTVYAARNLLELWPAVRTIWRGRELMQILSAVLGSGFGLVRVLYFDKPPGNSWALPWHKDLTIAVQNNRLPSERFCKPTAKAGVPHVEAPVEVLQQMLTMRLHLDAVDEENGPLKVIPGSHRTGKTMTFAEDRIESLHARVGDVLLIRPLVTHCSNRSHDDTIRHRRILHLEFAGCRELPDDYRWHDFVA